MKFLKYKTTPIHTVRSIITDGSHKVAPAHSWPPPQMSLCSGEDPQSNNWLFPNPGSGLILKPIIQRLSTNLARCEEEVSTASQKLPKLHQKYSPFHLNSRMQSLHSFNMWSEGHDAGWPPTITPQLLSTSHLMCTVPKQDPSFTGDQTGHLQL